MEESLNGPIQARLELKTSGSTHGTNVDDIVVGRLVQDGPLLIPKRTNEIVSSFHLDKRVFM